MPPLIKPWYLVLEETPQWEPLRAPVRSVQGHRSWETLLAVVAQFHVATSLRYQPSPKVDGGTCTWCNVFVWDVTRALDAEVPHWVGPDDLPAQPGPRARELTANGICAWLSGPVAWYLGWRSVPESEARVLAAGGDPVVAGWANGHDLSGHVAVVLPGEAAGPTMIAQAGATCFERGPLAQGFGTKPVHFWAHA